MLARGEYTVSPLADGETGAAGRSVSSITEEYYLSTSKTAQAGGSWVASPPAWSAGKYLWTRSKIVYADPAGTVYTAPVCDSSWEAVNDVQVGGRNLIILKNTTPGKYVNTDGTLANSTAGAIASDFIAVAPSSTYIYSGAASSGNLNQDICFYTNDKTFISPRTRMTNAPTYGFTTPATAAYMRISSPSLAVIKLERGNKATDWTPAPEDIEGKIGELESGQEELREDLGEASEAVSQLDALSLARLEAINDTIAGLNDALSTIHTNADENNTVTGAAIAAVNAAIGQLNAEAAAIARGVTGLEAARVLTDQYIRTGLLYIDEGGIPRYGVAVGENLTMVTDENGHVVVERAGLACTMTSDRISFWQLGAEVSYFANGEMWVRVMRTKKLIIEDEAQSAAAVIKMSPALGLTIRV